MAIWQHEVRAGAHTGFEALYGADGAWVALSGERAGSLDAELPGDADSGRWRSHADYQTFLAADPARHADPDAQGDALTLSERRTGHYAPIAAP